VSRKFHHILMADVVSSSSREQIQLRAQLKSLVKNINSELHERILSPYTITLGDEFQGISNSLYALLESIFFLEEQIIKRRYTFKLHYVAHFGEIQTPINRKIAYEMMGPGLTHARKLLTRKQRERPRFTFDYPNQFENEILNNLFFVLEHVIDRWRLHDYPLIVDLISDISDSSLAKKRKKDRSLIWRRRKSLRAEEYTSLKTSAIEFSKWINLHKG
jgi:hypothetical protein